MTSRLYNAIAATAIVMAAAAAQAGGLQVADRKAALAPVYAFIADVNKGDMKSAASLFTARNDVTDEFAPFHWTGNGFEAWLADYTKMAAAGGFTAGTLHPRKPDVTLTQDRGYVVMPMRITWLQRGKKGGEEGDFVVVLAKEGADWRITSWTWTRR